MINGCIFGPPKNAIKKQKVNLNNISKICSAENKGEQGNELAKIYNQFDFR